MIKAIRDSFQKLGNVSPIVDEITENLIFVFDVKLELWFSHYPINLELEFPYELFNINFTRECTASIISKLPLTPSGTEFQVDDKLHSSDPDAVGVKVTKTLTFESSHIIGLRLSLGRSIEDSSIELSIKNITEDTESSFGIQREYLKSMIFFVQILALF